MSDRWRVKLMVARVVFVECDVSVNATGSNDAVENATRVVQSVGFHGRSAKLDPAVYGLDGVIHGEREANAVQPTCEEQQYLFHEFAPDNVQAQVTQVIRTGYATDAS